MTDKIKNKIYRKVCPICKKEITSLSEEQADYNFKAHLISCEKKHKDLK